MKYRQGERDHRRVGCVFEDDPLQETCTDMTAIENWKSVMTGEFSIYVYILCCCLYLYAIKYAYSFFFMFTIK